MALWCPPQSVVVNVDKQMEKWCDFEYCNCWFSDSPLATVWSAAEER